MCGSRPKLGAMLFPLHLMAASGARAWHLYHFHLLLGRSQSSFCFIALRWASPEVCVAMRNFLHSYNEPGIVMKYFLPVIWVNLSTTLGDNDDWVEQLRVLKPKLLTLTMARKSSLFKVILFGDGEVGKSCLMNRYVTSKFDTQFFHTIGVEFLSKDLEVDGYFGTM